MQSFNNGEFVFNWDTYVITVDFRPRDNQSEKYWAEDDPEHTKILEKAFIILEALGFPSLTEVNKRYSLDEDPEFAFKTNKISITIASPRIKDWKKPNEKIIPYHDFITILMHTNLADYYMPQMLKRFQEEDWYSRLSKSEVTMEEAQEYFDKLYHEFYSVIPPVPEEYQKALKYIQKKLDKEQSYLNRIEGLKLYNYFILQHCQWFCSRVQNPRPDCHPSYDINDDGGSLMLKEGNDDDATRKTFIDFIKSLALSKEKVVWPSGNYRFNIDNIQELEDAVEQSLSEWNPETFNIPQRILDNYDGYNELYEMFYKSKDDEWFEKMFIKSNLITLIKRDLKFWRPGYTKEYTIGYYTSPNSKYLDQELLGMIRESFNTIWGSPMEETMIDVWEFIQTSIIKAGGHM